MSNEKQKTILLVEDEAIISQYTSQIIMKFGYNVIIAYSGETAIENIINNDNINLILMDIDLGKGIDGTGAAKEILEKYNIPIVFLTSHSEWEMVDKVRGITRYGYVIKNSGEFVLQSSIEMAFELFEANKKISESESRLRTLVKTIPDYVWLKDVNGVYLSCNNMFEQFFGAKEADIVGKTDFNFVDKEQAEFFRDHDHNAMKAGKPTINEEWITFASDGHKALLETIKTPMFESDGKLIGVLGIARDITERKRAEENLRINEERYRMAQAIGHVGNWEYNVQTTHFWGSDEAKRIYGFNLEQPDFTTDEVENCIPEREQVHQALVDLIEKNKEYNLEFEIHPRNFSEPKIITSIAELQLDDQGKPLKIIGVIQDVTKRKRAEEEIQRQLNEKDVLLKEIHHRVKNNIANIEGLLSLQANSQSNPDVQIALKDTVSRIRSMRVLYDKLLISENYQDVLIKNYTESLIDSIIAVFPESLSVTIEKMIQNFSLVTKTATSVGIIINELLTNTFKYAFFNRDNNKISILIKKKENTVTLIIHDNGIGFDDRIEANKSSGLGLTIVKMLANQLQGSFSCVKENGTKSVIQFNI